MEKIQKVQDLLRLAKSEGNVHEAHSAACKAFAVAKEYNLGGQVVAHCLVTKGKTARRLKRSQLPESW